MPQYLSLPDGNSVTIREGETPMQTLARAMRDFPNSFEQAEEKPKEDTSGFMAAASAGTERMKGEAALTAAKLGMMEPEKAQKYYEEKKAEAEKRFTPTEKGWTQDPWLKIRELAGGSTPYMALPALAGLGALAAPEVGAAGLIGAGAAGLVSGAQFTGQNLARQMEEGKTLEEASGTKAALAAIPQAALDVISLRMVPGLGKIFGAAGKEITEETAKQIAQIGRAHV